MSEPFFLIDQLISQGITRFCIAPGARCAPLISIAARHPQAKTIVHFDERGLGFYALGYGKGAQWPAVIITTSGSAIGNLLPAVMEAHHSSIPLILLTADRPPELQSCGANQTTEQCAPFVPFIRWQANLPPTGTESYFRSIAAQAVFHATHNPPGPVHLNCQIRNPYQQPPLGTSQPKISFPNSEVRAPSMHTHISRGAIAIGEIPSSPAPIIRLAQRLGWPIFADLLSNTRAIPSREEIHYFDAIFSKKPHFKPDFLLHFGARLTSDKILNIPADLHISPYPFLQDPNRELKGRVCSDIAPFCETFTGGPLDPTWLTLWKEEERQVASELLTSSLPTDIRIMTELATIIPKDADLYFSNSMAIRHANTYFFPKTYPQTSPKLSQRFFSNRGLSGSDGNIATAAGIADGAEKTVIAWVGDQAALHDLNSLPLLHNTAHPVILMISNNFGGQIFANLPLATWPETETHIKAPHSWTFQKAAALFHLPYVLLDSSSNQRCNQIQFTKSSIVEWHC